MRARWSPLLLLLVSAGALAQDAPEPAEGTTTPTDTACSLGKAELIERVQSSYDAIDNADIQRHGDVIRDLESRLTCLQFVPEPELWAKLLVGIAIVEFSAAGNWKDPLATALWVHPTVDRYVGGVHPMARWEPPDRPPTTGEAVPEGIRLYIDGELVTEVPQTDGLHLIQLRTGDGYRSKLIRDEAVPADWLKVPDLLTFTEPQLPVRVAIGAALGVDILNQVPSTEGNYISSQSRTGLAYGAYIHGTAWPVSILAVRWDAVAMDWISVPTVDARVGVGVDAGGIFSATAGAGYRTVHVVEGDTVRLLGTVHPRMDVQVRYAIADIPFDVTASAGWMPSLAPVSLRAGAELGEGNLRGRVGLDARLALANLVQESFETRTIAVSEWTVGLTGGVVWGRR